MGKAGQQEQLLWPFLQTFSYSGQFFANDLYCTLFFSKTLMDKHANK